MSTEEHYTVGNTTLDISGPVTVTLPDMREAMEAMAIEIDELQRAKEELVSDLTDCLEFLQKNYDADYQGEETGYVPNEEMRLGTQIRATIEAHK